MGNNEKLAAELADEITGFQNAAEQNGDSIIEHEEWLRLRILNALNAAEADGYKKGAESKWLPIESAPKDGSEFLAVIKGCDSGRTRRVVLVASPDEDVDWLFDGCEISNAWDVVGWMPLSPAPKGEIK